MRELAFQTPQGRHGSAMRKFFVLAAACLPLAAGCAREKPRHKDALPAAPYAQAPAHLPAKRSPALPPEVRSHAVKVPYQSLRLESECGPDGSAPVAVYAVRLSDTLANLARATRPNGYYGYSYNDCSQSTSIVFTSARLDEYGLKGNRLVKYAAELVFQPDNSTISITMEGVQCSGEPHCVSLWEGVWIKTDYDSDPASHLATVYGHRNVTSYLDFIKTQFVGELEFRMRWILDTVRVNSRKAIGFFAIAESPPGEPIAKRQGGYLALGAAQAINSDMVTRGYCYWLLLEPGVPVPESLGIGGMKLQPPD